MSESNQKNDKAKEPDKVEKTNKQNPNNKKKNSSNSKSKNNNSKAKKNSTKKPQPKKEEVKEPIKTEEVKEVEEIKEVEETIEPIENQEETSNEFVEREDEDVEKELENIKNIVQTEVDKILEDSEYDDWNDLVKDARKEIKEEKEKKANPQKDVPMCECCGERPIDKSENSNSHYCTECRETMKNYPLSALEIISMFVVVALIALTAFTFSKSLYTYTTAIGAYELMQEGKYVSATKAYEDTISQFKVNDKNISKVVLNYEAELYYKQGFEKYEDLNYLLNKHYKEDDITFKVNPKMKKIKKSVDDFMDVQDIVNQSYQMNKSNYKEFTKTLDKKIKDTKKDDKKYEFDKGVVAFWKYYAAFMFQQSEKTQLKLLDVMKKEAPEYALTYLPLYVQTYMVQNEYDKVIKDCDKIIEINSQNEIAYTQKSIALRMKKDLKNANKQVKKGLESNALSSDLNHQMAILKLLDGKKSEALSYARLAFQNSKNQLSYLLNANTLALCARLNGDSDTIKQLEKELQQYGYTLSKEIDEVVDGTKTVKDIYLKGEGEIKWN